MKYRVRLDLSFNNEADARSLMDYAKSVTGKAFSINEGSPNEEIAYCDLELCRHDEGLPCSRLDKMEVRNPELHLG